MDDSAPNLSLCMLSVSLHSLIIGDKEPEPGTQTRLQSPLPSSCVVSELVYVKVMCTNIRTYSTYVCGVDSLSLPFTCDKRCTAGTRDNNSPLCANGLQAVDYLLHVVRRRPDC